VISDDVAVHKKEMEMLQAATASTQETAISHMMSGIVARYTNLVTAVDSRLNLLEKSVEAHELYCSDCHQCQEMITSAKQQLQRVQDGAWDGTGAVRQQMDRLKVTECFSVVLL